jgi:antitoxin (DNA-binding transcriptional repressor) of toxin-antitoxin stability system
VAATFRRIRLESGLRFMQASYSWIASEPQPGSRIATIFQGGYNSHMEKASVSKLKDNLSAYLRKVRAGHPVVIYDRDVPIARLERIESSGGGADRLALMYSQGVARPPARPLSPARLRALLSKAAPRSARLLEALMDLRAEDR